MSDVFKVIDLVTGYQPAAALVAAGRLGVYDCLADGPLSPAAVSDAISTDAGATRALLDALVGVELLTTDGSRYALTSAARRLASDGDLRLVAEKEAYFARVWLSLEDSVRTGVPQLAPWATRLATDPEQARSFLEALVVLAETTGPDLTSVIPTGSRVADLGGGLGAYAAPLAAAGHTVTLVDLPPVAAWAASVLPASVSVSPVDLLSPHAASTVGTASYDVALLSHLLHDLTDDDCATVLRVAHEILAPGGRVVVFELPGDPPGAFGPLFDLMMHVETPGRARRLAELVALVEQAGFSNVHVSAKHPLPHGVVVGTG
ncbi:acetylserotonin O-methyltransferase [Nocardioides sp. cx-169]|uniref:acetylserotonin O-methyltransferase n=1 Tax=Nocardioides sp. cx-169 TaxID=2899080 RepID=UPI001E402192|nr:acetylserotonin O-methyltransferase [Nocardioides sp. cx-169]MCD4533567.1 acetylserotonin O-methyltransferase [Nocardioides sp. cx-169]